MAASVLTACGGSSDPMPTSLDIPASMDARLKDFFTICPIAMSSTDDALEKAKSLSWEMGGASFDDPQPSFFDAYNFEKMVDGTETDLLMNVMHARDSAAVVCQMSLNSYGSDEGELPDFSQIDKAFNFDGQYEDLGEVVFGSWNIGKYPDDVYIFVNARKETYAFIVMSRRVPKSHPIFNR